MSTKSLLSRKRKQPEPEEDSDYSPSPSPPSSPKKSLSAKRKEKEEESEQSPSPSPPSSPPRKMRRATKSAASSKPKREHASNQKRTDTNADPKVAPRAAKPVASSKPKREYASNQKRRTDSFPRPRTSDKMFNYGLDFKKLDVRKNPDLYRVGKGEQGVLLVEPYKGEICPHWKFATPEKATKSSQTIYKMFLKYLEDDDFIGADMARKFLQMGYTRARRYANHASGRKYDKEGNFLPYDNDEVKAESARIFYPVWKEAEENEQYKAQKAAWKERLG